MKRMFVIAGIATALASGSMRLFAESTTVEEHWLAAHAAYDRGDHAEALQHYRAIQAAGIDNAVIWYNLANTHFRAGRIGDAVLHYRRAWYLSPRDPDTAANLELAQQRVGAVSPVPRLIDRAAQELSHAEWTTLFRFAYWLAILAGAVALTVPRSRRFTKPVAITAAGTALLALGGWEYWRRWQHPGEAVVMAPNVTAMYEPREQATPFFTLPEGSIIRLEDRFDAWTKVRAGGKSGWIPSSKVKRVYPWQPTSND
ncbi:MAG TPA: tetratricopeptide repeat protein [Kiritimatiellia bacterium]|nr:tetratricopeptide repeat protein [Kiritimatiellia bacterium]